SDVQSKAYETQGYIQVVYLLAEGADLSVYNTLDSRSEVLHPELFDSVMRNRSEASELKQRLSRYRIITLGGSDYQQALKKVEELKNHGSVEIAYVNTPVQQPVLLESSQTDNVPELLSNDLTHHQYYLKESYDQTSWGSTSGYGVNAYYAWDIPGGTGENVQIVSLEGSRYSVLHDDLQYPFLQVFSGGERFIENEHNTNSVGIMTAKNNGFGVTGISYNSRQGWGRFTNVGQTMITLAETLPKGSVIQCSMGFGDESAEGVQANFDAIQYLTQEKGIHFVLSAGNDGNNFDDPKYDGRYDKDIRDSGSIMVGAGSLENQRMGFSNYGSRIDVFAQGEYVTTTSVEEETGYTRYYNGTSSAAPIVAGAVAVLQSIIDEYNLTYSTEQVRDILSHTGREITQNDGTLLGTHPDLKAAIEYILTDAGITPNTSLVINGENVVKWSDSAELTAEWQGSEAVTYQWSQITGETVHVSQNTEVGSISIQTNTLSNQTQTLSFKVDALNDTNEVVSSNTINLVVNEFMDITWGGNKTISWGDIVELIPNISGLDYFYTVREDKEVDYQSLESREDTLQFITYREPDAQGQLLSIENKDQLIKVRAVASDPQNGLVIDEEYFDIHVTQTPIYSEISGDKTVLWGNDIQLNAHFSHADIDLSEASYRWFDEEGNELSSNQSITMSTSDLSNITQTKTLTAELRRVGDVIWQEEVEVTVEQDTSFSQVSLSGNTVANWGEEFDLSASLAPEKEGMTYEWKQISGNQDFTIQATGSDAIILTSDLANTDYRGTIQVTVFDANGEVEDTLTQELSVKAVDNGQPMEMQVTGDTVTTWGNSASFTAQLHNYQGEVVAYSWNVADINGNSLNGLVNPQSDNEGNVTIDTSGLENVNQTIKMGVAAIGELPDGSIGPVIIHWEPVQINKLDTSGEAKVVIDGATTVSWGEDVNITASLDNGYPLVAYIWTQVSGEDALYDGYFDGSLHVKTSSLTNKTQQLGFEVIARDKVSGQDITSEIIMITVNETGTTIDPSVTIAGNTAVDWGNSTTLTATAMDTGDATIEYRWTQTSGETANLTVDAQTGIVVLDSSSMTNANATIGMQVDVIDTATGDVLVTETTSVTVNKVSTGGGDIPVWVAGQTDPETGDIFSHNGSCWEAQNNPGAWEEPREGWFWTEVECQ
ncbi:S8 family serine peptidase, partial [Vibrio sp.]|nr:S8 family serine peptidase [Vibrio sp.]